MKKSTVITAVVGALIVLALIIVYRLGGTLVGAKVDEQIARIGLTPNQVAAHGPLPGDVSLYAKELACQNKIPTPGYYSSLNGAEISDSERSGLFPCASFTGSLEGPDNVYAWKSADDYPGISYMNNRKPGELYLVGGEYPTLDDPNMVGPFVAKADATTGKEIWRTYLDNPNASGRCPSTASPLRAMVAGSISRLPSARVSTCCRSCRSNHRRSGSWWMASATDGHRQDGGCAGPAGTLGDLDGQQGAQQPEV